MGKKYKIIDYKYNPEFYFKFRMFVKKFMHLFYKINVTGLENIEPDKTYLYAGNHLNILDSWLLLAILDINIRFMVDPKLYRYKSWQHFFKSVGTFSIDQEKTIDTDAIKTACNLLKNKEHVAIFPEGKTHNKNEHVDFKPGVPKIAKISNAELIPFGINGSYKPFHQLNINFGKSMTLDKGSKHEWDNNLEQMVRELEKGPVKKLTQ